MLFFPNAKINLGLHIVEKRGDGYHNIESVFYPLPILDGLEAVIDPELASGDLQFTFSGIEIPGNGAENFCQMVHRELSKQFALPGLKAHLHKHIPIGAGLGGGSADAAFFVNLLDDLCQLGISLQHRLQIAARIGSDCAFFIRNKPAFCFGRGELMQPSDLNLKGVYALVYYPNIHISTQLAYSKVKPRKPNYDLRKLDSLSMEHWREVVINDFEISLFNAFPRLAYIKEELYAAGAVYAAMSGSGSSVFGLFSQKPNPPMSLSAENLIFNGLLG
jgi:4-diphosphocytidyl-2-C-methyl-D-erythritol kinase